GFGRLYCSPPGRPLKAPKNVRRTTRVSGRPGRRDGPSGPDPWRDRRAGGGGGGPRGERGAPTGPSLWGGRGGGGWGGGGGAPGGGGGGGTSARPPRRAVTSCNLLLRPSILLCSAPLRSRR